MNHTSVPHSGSAHAAFTIAAACSGVGGRGLAGNRAGGSASSIGLAAIHRSRCARRNAPLRIQWICRMLDAAKGRQV